MMGKAGGDVNLPAGLLRSVALTESRGDQFGKTRRSRGLFQFMPGTARDMGLRGNDVFDPDKINGSCTVSLYAPGKEWRGPEQRLALNLSDW